MVEVLVGSTISSNPNQVTNNTELTSADQTAVNVSQRSELAGQSSESGDNRESQLNVRPSQVVLLDLATTSASLPPPPPQTSCLTGDSVLVEASGDTAGEQKANREKEFNYKPLPPLPDELVTAPPQYSLIVNDVGDADCTPSSSTSQEASSGSGSSQSRIPVLSLYDVDRSGGRHRCRAYHIRGPGAMGFPDSVSHSTERAARNKAMVISLVAFLCVPILGWLPLMLSCVMMNCSDGMSVVDRNKLSKFIMSFSVVCLLAGVTLAMVYAPRFTHYHKH